jgi:hypothetical protein
MKAAFSFAPRDAERIGVTREIGFRRCWMTVGIAVAILAGSGATLRAQTGWQSRDIGTATAGSTSESGGVISIAGSGRDIWNEADGFRYYYREVPAEFDLVVRVRSLQNTYGWAKAAIMTRYTLEPGSPI